MRFYTFFLILITGLFIFFNCSDEGVSPDQKEYVIPDKNISYYKDLQPMFNGKCGFGSNCHSPENKNPLVAGLSFNDKQVFMDYVVSHSGKPLVDISKHQSQPHFAPLYEIVTTQYFGLERQPPLSAGREPLNKNQTEGIKQWIKEGAKD